MVPNHHCWVSWSTINNNPRQQGGAAIMYALSTRDTTRCCHFISLAEYYFYKNKSSKRVNRRGAWALLTSSSASSVRFCSRGLLVEACGGQILGKKVQSLGISVLWVCSCLPLKGNLKKKKLLQSENSRKPGLRVSWFFLGSMIMPVFLGLLFFILLGTRKLNRFEATVWNRTPRL